jgi:hypothetical protein
LHSQFLQPSRSTFDLRIGGDGATRAGSLHRTPLLATATSPGCRDWT